MKLRRAYLDIPLRTGAEIQLAGDQAHYLGRVLRLRPGFEVQVFNGDGFNYQAEITRVEKKTVNLKLLGKQPGLPSSPLKIQLVQALSRGERMDFSLQKATELGVDSIQLLNSSRVELQLDEKRLQRRMHHWRQVMNSACEQCGRAEIPALLAPLEVEEFIAKTSTIQRLILDPLAREGISRIELSIGPVMVLVGPEGGFTVAELELFRQAGVQGLSLGPRILRTETAGPAIIAILQQKFGDLV